MKVKIEIEAETALELSERLIKLALHVMRSDKPKPIKILADNGTTIASLRVEDEDEFLDVFLKTHSLTGASQPD